MDKPISRFTAGGQILPNMPDIPQVIKSTTASLSEHVQVRIEVPKFCTEETGATSVWPTVILSTDTFDNCLSLPMIKNSVLLWFYEG